jgi:hypothetical protein
VAPLLVIALALGIGVIALGTGYGLGRADGASIDRRWQALALRTDADDWLGLIAANSDVGKTLRENCGAGGKAAYLVHGARACTIPLWLDGAPAPVAGPGPVGLAGLLKWVSDWALAFGAAGGVFAGLVLRKILMALGARSSVQWLVDL